MSQRLVNDNFWTDAWIEDKDPSEKLVYLYLLTNPLCNIAGIYEIKLKRIAFETGYDKDTVDKILNRFVEEGKILRCDEWILIKNFAKNQSVNPNVRKGMQRIIDELPDKIKALKGFGSLSHFTLLNLTLPNFTKPNGFVDFENDNFPSTEISEETSEIPELEIITEGENLEDSKVPPAPPALPKEKSEYEISMDYLRTFCTPREDKSLPIFDTVIETPDFAVGHSTDWRAFLAHWIEKDKKGKMKAEGQKTFDIKLRFLKWLSNGYGNKQKNSSIIY